MVFTNPCTPKKFVQQENADATSCCWECMRDNWEWSLVITFPQTQGLSLKNNGKNEKTKFRLASFWRVLKKK